MATNGSDDESTTTQRSDIRRYLAIPMIALALALVGVGVYQVVGGGDDDSTDVEVGGTRQDRSITTLGDAPASSTTVIVGDGETGLDVSGDGGQVGILPAQTEER